MSKTTNLQLFKHDEPLESNENDFDVGEALNDNWDILDTFAGQVDTRLETLENDLDEISTNLDTLETSIETIQSNVTSLQTDNETNKQNIQDLQTEQETQNTSIQNNTEELELLKNNLPDPITTEESEEITVKDAMNYYSQLDVSGNSMQEQTEQGANLWWDNDTMHFSNENRQNLTTQTIKAGTYKFSCDVSNLVLGTNTFLALYGENTYSDETSELSFGYIDNITANGRYSKEVVIPKDISTLQLKISATQATNGGSMTISNLCLRTDDSDVYVEYVPDSPSPDYPSKIKNCGDNVNLFDDEIEQGNINGETGVNEDNSNRIRSKNYVEIPANTKKIRVIRSVANNEFWLRFYDENKSYLGFLASAATDNNANVLDFNMNQNAKYIRFVDLSNDLNSKIKITTDLGCSGYSPYKCGSVDIKVENSNTFNQANGFKSGGTDRAVVNEDGSITTTSNFSNSRNKGVFVELKKNTNYTVSLDIVSMETSSTNKRGIAEVCSYNEDESFNSGLIANKIILDTDVGTRISFSFNSGDYDKWAVQVSGWYGSGQTGSLTYKNVMVSELTDINFVEHKEKIITFPLKEGQLLHEGDYLASDGVHHVKQTCVFDGTENVLSGYLDETIDSFRIVISGKYNQMLSYQIDDKCSHFKNLGHTPAWGRKANTFALSSEGYLYVFFKKNIIASEIEAKNWITEQYNNGTPLTAEGTLEEEHIEPYTEEQQAVYNELKNLILYKGYNYITCTDETKCKMQLTYRPDNNVKIKSLEERIAALESEATV